MTAKELAIQILASLNPLKKFGWDELNASQLGVMLKLDVLKLIKDLANEEISELQK